MTNPINRGGTRLSQIKQKITSGMQNTKYAFCRSVRKIDFNSAFYTYTVSQTLTNYINNKHDDEYKYLSLGINIIGVAIVIIGCCNSLTLREHNNQQE